MDDEIIYSWCFNSIECFDSTSFAAIIILNEDLESFSSLSSQHYVHPYKPWNVGGNVNYKDHRPPYPHKPYSPPYNQPPRQTNESNVLDFQVMMEQLTKSVHGMSQQLKFVTNRMDQMEEHVRPPMTVMKNTRCKEKEMGSNKGQFPTQPSINPRNISSIESQEFSPPEDSLDSSPQAFCDGVHAITRLRSGKILEDPIECDLEDKKKEIEEENEDRKPLGKDMNLLPISHLYPSPKL